jgi:hypothetical protein
MIVNNSEAVEVTLQSGVSVQHDWLNRNSKH